MYCIVSKYRQKAKNLLTCQQLELKLKHMLAHKLLCSGGPTAKEK